MTCQQSKPSNSRDATQPNQCNLRQLGGKDRVGTLRRTIWAQHQSKPGYPMQQQSLTRWTFTSNGPERLFLQQSSLVKECDRLIELNNLMKYCINHLSNTVGMVDLVRMEREPTEPASDLNLSRPITILHKQQPQLSYQAQPRPQPLAEKRKRGQRYATVYNSSGGDLRSLVLVACDM